VLQPPYQRAIQKAMEKLFPSKIVYDDEKDICTMLFESVLFEATHAGTTLLSYFVEHASLSTVEKQVYQSWVRQTRFGCFRVEKIVRGKELQLSDLSGEAHYRIFEDRATATLNRGNVMIARIVPFLDGWMITSETILSFPANTTLQQLTKTYGTVADQLLFTRRYHQSRKAEIQAGLV
jgi:hypothetical protein